MCKTEFKLNKKSFNEINIYNLRVYLRKTVMKQILNNALIFEF